MNIGSGVSGELTLLDILSIMSFYVGIMNLEENLTQGDKQDLQQDLTNKAEMLLNEIHSHLKLQDEKIDRILEVLENDGRRNL